MLGHNVWLQALVAPPETVFTGSNVFSDEGRLTAYYQVDIRQNKRKRSEMFRNKLIPSFDSIIKFPRPLAQRL